MLAISTKGIGIIDATNPQTTGKSKTKEATDDTFAMLMNSASIANEDTNAKVDSDFAVKANDGYSKNDVAAGSKETSDNVENLDKKNSLENDKKNDMPNDVKAKKADNNSSENDTIEKEDALENEVIAITGSVNVLDMIPKDAIEEFEYQLAEILEVSVDELGEILENKGIDISTLFNPENLKEFVLDFKDATAVEALVDENLNNLLNNCADMLEKLSEKYDIDYVDVKELDVVPETEEVDYSKDLEEKKVEKEDNETIKVSLTKEETNKVKAYSEDTKSSLDNNKDQAKQDIISNLSNAIADVNLTEGVEEINTFDNNVSEVEILKQIVDEIEAKFTNDTTSLELQLNPEHLGKVQISVSTRNGVVQARIVTESEAARAAVEASLDTLKETFNNKEIKVEAVEVMVGTSEFFNGEQNEQAENDDNSFRNISSGIGTDGDDAVIDDEMIEEEIMQAKGNTVSYSI